MAAVYTFDEDTVSDLHKDAYGFRPAQYWFSAWQQMSDDEKQAEWNSLLKALERAVEEDNVRERQAIALFEKNVTEAIALGAGDRATAIRWLMDGARANGDTEMFEYERGIPFGYIKKTA